MNLENALTTLVTLRHAKTAGDLRPLWSPKGMPKWRPAWSSIIRQVLANNLRLSSGHVHFHGIGNMDKPPFDESTGATLRGHPGLARSQAHLYAYGCECGFPPAGLSEKPKRPGKCSKTKCRNNVLDSFCHT